mmetsp:Transcript_19141/g.56851  ORF Transcript_19141/g.56851 Transcript_19141/m.56851 type:complete len:530 (-) Transcript_19141:17-1606(-)
MARTAYVFCILLAKAQALTKPIPTTLSGARPTTQLGRAATFWKYATPVVTRYLTEAARINLNERLLGRCLSDEECEVVWDDANVAGGAAARSVVDELGGFYVKTGQIIASRQDLFPKQYSDALAGLTDYVDPLSSETVRGVVAEEVLRPGEVWGDVFAEWDDEPLGAASVAQVHRAVLTEAYGGREVAVKVQRPGVEDTLLGDVRQLKALAKPARDITPVDYYIVFQELESQLADEFDFVAEAAAMERIKSTLDKAPGGAPLVVPSVVPGLCTRRVLVMDFLRGEPLSRVAAKYDLTKDAAARAAGRALLAGLTEAFGRCIFQTGFFHADPHPGNLLVLDDGRIGLIDFGQVKQISGKSRATLGKVMCALATRRRSAAEPWGILEDLKPFTVLGDELGVVLADGAPEPEGPAAVSMWLFDDAAEPLPGGYEQSELSPKAPAQSLQSFPQDLVLVARSSVLIKGLAAKLNVRWSLAAKWAPIAVESLGMEHPGVRRRSRAGKVAAGLRARGQRLVAPYVQRRLERQRKPS